MGEATRPSSALYFYGRISRDEAEKILRDGGCSEGLFLLRESMSSAGNYALSICHNNRVHHYSIERQPDGTYMIQDGKKFPGPIELVSHHKKHQDGFLTKPTMGCNRANGSAPMAWPGVTMLILEECLLKEANKLGLEGAKLENMLGPQRQYFISLVAKDLHRTQPWFHGRIEREEADNVMRDSVHKDGKYLVRVRGSDRARERMTGDFKSYALSLSYRNETKHYKIECHQSGGGQKYAIEEGPRFDCLMDMIAHYHNKADGLLCKLSVPCVKPGFQPQTTRRPEDSPNPIYNGLVNSFIHGDLQEPEPEEQETSSRFEHRQSLTDTSIGPISNEDQKIYDTVPFNLDRNSVVLHEKLGSGNFGSVMRGTVTRMGQSIPVAVKTLKTSELPNAKSELMREARLMADLQHRNIVRMIGICEAEMIMLVLELASKGPLNKYLKHHPEMQMNSILELMFQVAQGMAFLESKNFVHRDLAARNVLLVNESFAKISDFGMSKALGIESDYYQAQSAGKWPLKWYAPECIYFFRFDSKSDVWSYGVTLWEGASYGAKPYKGMRGQQILQLIDDGRRLDKPDKCPPGVYEVMRKCWQYDKEDRPTFKDIVELLRKYR